MSYLQLNEGAAPATPAAGKGTHYESTVGEPHFINDDGVDMNLSPNAEYNYLRNGGMWFAQRQNPVALTTYSNVGGRAITADGWGISNENASIQYLRTDTATAAETNLAARYYGNFTKITSAGKLLIAQVIEGTDTANLRGNTVRVQFKLKSIIANLAVRIGVSYLNAGNPDTGIPAAFVTAFNGAGTDPTLGANMVYLAPKAGVAADGGTVNGNAVDCNLTTANWVRFGAVFDIPTSARNVVVMIWSNAQLATTNGIAVSEASLTIGQAIQDWVPQALQTEFAKVQRFYSKTFNVDTGPAQAVGLLGVARGFVNTAGATAGQIFGARFPVPMRVAPTMVFFNPAAANAFVRNTFAGTDATATTGANISEQGVDITFTGIAAWVVGSALAVHYTADAEI